MFIQRHQSWAKNLSDVWFVLMQAALVFMRGRHVSAWGFLKTWLPFCAIMAVGLTFGR
jgi:hypothetical protein